MNEKKRTPFDEDRLTALHAEIADTLGHWRRLLIGQGETGMPSYALLAELITAGLLLPAEKWARLEDFCEVGASVGELQQALGEAGEAERPYLQEELAGLAAQRDALLQQCFNGE